jgi:DNA-binding transcriptional regulator/RsmH inhibitor MraZ
LFSTVDDYPKGFPRLAAFQNSDDDLVIFRVFNQSHIRILIQDEVEITKLEEDLKKLDFADDTNKATNYRLKNTMHEDGWDAERVNLMQKLRTKLIEYGKLPKELPWR